MGKRSPLANILDGKEIEVVERLGVADEIAALFRSKGIKGDVSREQFVELLDQVLERPGPGAFPDWTEAVKRGTIDLG